MMHRKIAWLGMEVKSSQPRRNASRRSLYVMSRMIGCEGAAAEPVSTWVMSEPPELFNPSGPRRTGRPPKDQPHRGQRQKLTPAIVAAHSQNQECEIFAACVAT